MDKIRILIADDHKLVREGIKAMLSGAEDIDIVGEAASGIDAINIARKSQPHVVLMDVVMPGMNGIEASRWIKENDAGVRIVIVSMDVSKDFVYAAVQSNVDGYLPKDVGADVLIDAIRSVHSGERYFYETIERLIAEDFTIAEKLKSPYKVLPNQLTKRENEVLMLVGSGSSYKEIAQQLAISLKTVEAHRAHILMKLGLNNNSELIRYAYQSNTASRA